MKKTYKIDIDCANCCNLVEDAVKKIDGVKDASANFMTLKMKIEFEDGADVDAVMEKVIKEAKKVEPDCEIFV
jgi:copper chaperone CopZ